MGETTILKCRFIILVLLVHLLINTNLLAEAESSTYPKLTADSAVLIDAKTGQVLFEKNMHKKKYPASITKIMTGMLALEKGNLADRLTMSSEAVFSIGRNTSHIALNVEEELTLEQALYAISLESANDAANGIAEHISGNLASFARLMNKKARECGAMNTNFVNAHGLPDTEHYTTAYDMAKIMMEAIKTPMFTEIFGETHYQIPPTNKQPETRYLNNKNSLLNGKYQCAGIIASKSGWTSQASHTLVTAAKRGNRELVAVVMDNPSLDGNYKDTITLLEYGFNDFLEITLEVSDLEKRIPELNFNNPEGVILKTDKPIVRLLHNTVSPDDLETSCEVLESNVNGAVKIKIALNLKQPNKYMYGSLGEISLRMETGREDGQYSNDAKNKSGYFPAGCGLISLSAILFFFKKRSSRIRKKYTLYRNFRL